MAPRKFPYIWVTWITGLLAGDDLCQWAAWFKAHNQGYDKRARSDGALLVQWKAAHAEQVRDRAAQLQAEGWLVFLEQQNRLRLRGHVAELAGAADIVAVKMPAEGAGPKAPVEALIVDVKSGKERDKDVWQVFVYMRFLPLVHDVLRHYQDRLVLHGEVRYPNGSVEFNGKSINEKSQARIKAVIQTVAGVDQPRRVPSESECLYCDIAQCPDRIVSTRTPDEVVEPNPEAGF